MDMRRVGLRFTALRLFALVLCLGLFSGCIVFGSDRIFVRKESITAFGPAHRNTERNRLMRITIDMDKLDKKLRDDIWLGLSPGEKVRLSSITLPLLQQHEVRRSYPTNAGCALCVGEFFFIFEKDVFKSVEFDEQKPTIALHDFNPQIGSFSRNTSLRIPCSVPAFESVFGTCDVITTEWDYDTM